jgi:DNA-binding transcriptional MerR regulator
MRKTEFTAREAAAIAGVPYQTLDRWITQGVVSCEVPAGGTGTRRRFSERDVVFVMLAAALKDQNLPLPAVRSLLRMLRDAWPGEDPESAGFLALKLWRESYSGLYVENRAHLHEHLDSVFRTEIEPETWTGVVLLIDVAFLARRAFAQLNAP